jgi:hypothetical protein
MRRLEAVSVNLRALLFFAARWSKQGDLFLDIGEATAKPAPLRHEEFVAVASRLVPAPAFRLGDEERAHVRQLAPDELLHRLRLSRIDAGDGRLIDLF